MRPLSASAVFDGDDHTGSASSQTGIVMCGIVGLFLKDDKLAPELGALLAGMLGTRCDRGPDSAGFAVYGAGVPDAVKLTLRAPDGFDFAPLLARLSKAAGVLLSQAIYDTHVVVVVPAAREAVVRAEFAQV